MRSVGEERLSRWLLTGQEVLALPASVLARHRGMLILRSIDDAYAPAPGTASLSSRVLQHLSYSLDDQSAVYLCRIGIENIIVQCSPAELYDKWFLLNAVTGPWTLIITGIPERRAGIGGTVTQRF